MEHWKLFHWGNSLEEGLLHFRETPGAVLLDVRSPKEYAEGHIPGAVNLPVERIEEISFPRSVPLFLYCYSGARSSHACAWLAGHGYSASNIGGIANYHGKLVTVSGETSHKNVHPLFDRRHKRRL